MGNLATDLDGKVMKTYATTTARGTANPSPATGDIAYVTDTSAGALNHTVGIYNGSAWVPYYRSPLCAYKTATESVTSNTTVQADDNLVLTLEINTVYILEMWLICTGLDAADLKYNFTYPANCSVALGAVTYNTASTGAAPVVNAIGAALDNSSPTTDFTAGTITGVAVNAQVSGLVSVGATAGSLQLMWAQNTSSGTAVVMETGSWIRLMRAS